MPWSVLAPEDYPVTSQGHRWVFDVVVPRGPRTEEMAAHRRRPGYYQNVLLVGRDHATGEVRRIRLGAVMHVTCELTPNWWAMGYYPGYLDRATIPGAVLREENPVESARGFATRRYAIEHMLRRTGWWPER